MQMNATNRLVELDTTCQHLRWRQLIAAALRLPLLVACFSTCLCVLVGAASAQESEPAPPSKQLEPTEPSGSKELSADEPEGISLATVRQALRQLESEQAQQRDAAEKQLVELGPTVLPLLPQITPRTSGELKGRLQRIRQALQRVNIESFFEASTVTLSGSYTLTDALAQIEQQTQNEIELQSGAGGSSANVQLAAEEQPFWSVMSEIMDQAKLRINPFGTTEGKLVLSPGAPASVQPFFSGPFQVQAISVQSRRVFNSPLDGQLDLSIQLAWEPRLEPVFLEIPMATVKATTSDGGELAAANAQAVLEIPLNLGGCTTQIDLQLARPERSVAKIASLTGDLVVAVPGERHEYVFARFGNGARQTEKYGEVTVTLEGARRNGAVYEMRILASFGDAQGALESFRGWILSNQAYLLDANGKKMENVGLQTYAITPNAVGIAYLFQINADPDSYKLVYESPSTITKQTFSYELVDIELP